MLKPRPLHWFLALMLVTSASGSGMFGCAQGVGVDETEVDDDDDNSRPPPSSSLAGPDSTTSPGSGGSGPAGPGSGGAGPSTTGAGAAGGAGPSTTGNTSSTAATTSSTSNTTATTSAVTSTAASSTAASSSSSGGCTPTNVLLDGGYEGGPSSTAWAQSSTNFGTPICDVAGCGNGGGTGPASGTYWAWFGGSSLLSEISTTTQSMVIPVGMATLEFKIELPACDSPLDVFTASIDGQTVYSVTGGSAACGQMGYQQVVVNVGAFADGGTHTLELRGDTIALLLSPTNFMVDDVMLVGCL